MSTPYGHNITTFSVGSAPGTPTPASAAPQFITHLGTPSQRGKSAAKGPTTGAKRGRKPKNAVSAAVSATNSPRIQQANFFQSTPAAASSTTQYTGNHYQPQLNWALPNGSTSPGTPAPGAAQPSGQAGASTSSARALSETPGPTDAQLMPPPPASMEGIQPQPILQGRPAPDEDIEGDDELLPAMAEDDYSAQLSFQAESKDNLKYAQPLMIRYANTYSLQSAHG